MKLPVVPTWSCSGFAIRRRRIRGISNGTVRPERGRQRTVIVVDERETRTAQQADLFLQLPRVNASAALATIRSLIAGQPLNEASVVQTTGIGFPQWQELTDRMTSAHYGSWFYGCTTGDAEFDLDSDQIYRLIRELNHQTRFVLLSMRNDHNGLSAENVLAWSSGFPFAVNLQRGYPRYNGLEYSAAAILNRQETDLVLLFSSNRTEQLIAGLDQAARKHFDTCQKIVIANAPLGLAEPPSVLFNVTCPGIRSKRRLLPAGRRDVESVRWFSAVFEGFGSVDPGTNFEPTQPVMISSQIQVLYFVVLMLASCGGASCLVFAQDAVPPNIVLIVADDLGYGELGCQGNRQIPTPNIDSIAAGGIRFTQGYVTASFCSASRAGLLTGRYQTRFGYEANPTGAHNEDPDAGLPVGEQTIADVLVDSGYVTGLFGKWHLGGTAKYHPYRRGFDEFFGFLHEGHYYVPPPYRNTITMLRRKIVTSGCQNGVWKSANGRLYFPTNGQ